MSAIAKAFSLKDAHSRIMCAKYVLISSDGTSGDLNECNWCNDTQFSSSKLCYNHSPTGVNSLYSSRTHSILFLWVEWCLKRSIVSSLTTASHRDPMHLNAIVSPRTRRVYRWHSLEDVLFQNSFGTFSVEIIRALELIYSLGRKGGEMQIKYPWLHPNGRKWRMLECRNFMLCAWIVEMSIGFGVRWKVKEKTTLDSIWSAIPRIGAWEASVSKPYWKPELGFEERKVWNWPVWIWKKLNGIKAKQGESGE